MLDVKLKMIEEKLYEQITKTLEDCEVPLMFACSILKNIESKIQDKTISELSYKLLKKENENKEEDNNG